MSVQLQKALIKLGAANQFMAGTPEDVLKLKEMWETPEGLKATEFINNFETAKAQREAKRASDIAKASFWPEFGKKVGLGVGIAAGIGAITYAADLIVEKLRENKLKSQSSEYFAKMLEAHPTLQKEDPTLVARYWDSLYHFAPNMAQDPLAAGAYIKQSIARLSHDQFGGPPPETFNTLTQVQKQFKDSNKPGDSLSDSARKRAVEQIVGIGVMR